MGKGRSDRRGSAPKPASGFEWLYLQYLLVTGLYMLEPWERTLFNIVAILFLSLIGVTNKEYCTWNLGRFIAAVSSLWLFRLVRPFSSLSLLHPSPSEMTDKVTVLLRSVGDAPILKNKKYNIDASRDIAWLTQTVRTLLNLESSQSLFLYISQSFAPSPDHTLDVLRKCYSLEQSNELVIHYSTTPAWG